ARFNVAHDALVLLLRHLWSLRCLGVEGIAHLLRLRLVDQLLDELAVNLFLDEESAAGTAALALVEEEGKVRALHGGIQVRVGEDDIWALAAQLQTDALEIALGGRLHDELAGRVFAGEGNLVDIHVAADGGPGSWTVTGHDVDHTVGEASLLGQGRDTQSGERR